MNENQTLFCDRDHFMKVANSEILTGEQANTLALNKMFKNA